MLTLVSAQKCDAAKPICQQCAKANRPHDCEYDDGKTKSRTQVMQEKILRQEARIRELETFGGNPSLVGGSQHLTPNGFVPSSPSYFDEMSTRAHSPYEMSLSGAALVSNYPELSPPNTASSSVHGPPSWTMETTDAPAFDFVPIVDPAPPVAPNPAPAEPIPTALPQVGDEFAWSAAVISPPPAPSEPVPSWESEDIPMRTRRML